MSGYAQSSNGALKHLQRLEGQVRGLPDWTTLDDHEEEKNMTATDRVELGLKDASGCSCCGTSSPSTPVETSLGLQQTAILVQGMTCSHCVASVTKEIGTLEGVQNVTVELAPGEPSTVMIFSSTPLDADQVRAAVERAGYCLVADPA